MPQGMSKVGGVNIIQNGRLSIAFGNFPLPAKTETFFDHTAAINLFNAFSSFVQSGTGLLDT
jgi:hypothetical protein